MIFWLSHLDSLGRFCQINKTSGKYLHSLLSYSPKPVRHNTLIISKTVMCRFFWVKLFGFSWQVLLNKQNIWAISSFHAHNSKTVRCRCFWVKFFGFFWQVLLNKQNIWEISSFPAELQSKTSQANKIKNNQINKTSGKYLHSLLSYSPKPIRHNTLIIQKR